MILRGRSVTASDLVCETGVGRASTSFQSKFGRINDRL